MTVSQDVLMHHREGTLRLADGVQGVDAAVYTDASRFEREREHVFRNIPLLVAASCEVGAPGSYKTLEIAGTPVLIVRDADGAVRAFLNSCTHRGAILAQGCGEAARFTCPYHGWTFARDGRLLAVSMPKLFGEIDRDLFALKSFPVLERAGLIWAILNPDSRVDISAFLGGYDEMLAVFGFEGWRPVSRRDLPGPNWKLCFDAHLEFYHLPVLHRGTFGPSISPRTLYYHYGPHQRLVRPDPGRDLPEGVDIFDSDGPPAAEWSDESMMFGEWIIFPNVSINTFYSGGRAVILSQVIPGATVGESTTVQLFLVEGEQSDSERAESLRTADFLAHVVGDEDLPTSDGQQKVLRSGGLDKVWFGRNEGGLQHFHRWIDRIIDTPLANITDLFSAPQGTG